MRLVLAAGQPLDQRRVLVGGPVGGRPQRCRRRGGQGVEGERRRQPLGGIGQSGEYVVGLDVERLAGDRRGDVGVAVSVTADPAAQTHGRWARSAAGCRRRRRPAPTRTRGRRSAPSRTATPSKTAIAVRTSSIGPGFSERQLRGAPERGDLLEQLALALGLVRQVDGQPHPVDRGDGCPPARLGRVGGQHRVHLELGQQRGQPLRREPADDARERVGPVARRAAPQGAYALALLGQVDELEVDGERPGHLLGPQLVEPGDDGGGSLGGGDRVAGVDDGPAQPLDVVEQVGADRLAQHLAERCTEEPGPRRAARWAPRAWRWCAREWPGARRERRGLSSAVMPVILTENTARRVTGVAVRRHGWHTKGRNRTRNTRMATRGDDSVALR